MSRGLLTGYAVKKEFYSPDYASSSPLHEVPDVRTTLYWDPFILTDGHSKKITIQFFNNDISGKLKLVMEGVNENGKMTRMERVIE